MSKEVTVVTNGTYTLEETENANQFHFFWNDHGVLEDVGTLPIEMYARYMVQMAREGLIDNGYETKLFFEISEDKKVLRLTAVEATKPQLHIVKNEQYEAPDVTKPNFFKRVFARWLDK